MIKVYIKSGQNKWEVSIDASKTVGEFKEEISKVSEIPAGNQRLIYSGKILKDDQTVESYHILDGHSVHLVKSGGNNVSGGATGAAGATGRSGNGSANAGGNAESVPSNLSAGQAGGFNPLSDLTGARYAGYTNLPSADMFGPDGGLTNMPNQDDMLRMLDNPIMQSQMNEMLSNPQMIDFMIQSNPQLQAMGPQARQLLQSPFFRQMLTNPQMLRQGMQLANTMGSSGLGGDGAAAFPAPGEPGSEQQEQRGNDTNANADAGAVNPLASMLNPGSNPFAAMLNSGNFGASAGGGAADTTGGTGASLPAFDPSMLSSLLGMPQAPQATAQDNRPPEERYEQQLRQLNDMGFFEFDRNVAALRRSGGSVQGALDSLLNGDV
ncbi:hypothetical protein HG535_0A07730 [Zygotorulaspora mrakii]|uniref:Ubiquitin-like domain-containing protein n=1 Tax=Zygotorulaspora mrakii TaxID=42260 RepID=A0A7H9AX28_ZYGMR|nr:uncharacterized protein HG535_0A07730 [Zygotorulaspora mrakii]QLG70831.1 hypothetical protein HG535_0A07730 [Zygotorulaspora mrakii]